MNTLRVLLIEKDPGESERLSVALSGAHHDVLPAAGLDEASEALLVRKFDAVLLACPVPPAGMAEFTAKLRKLEKEQRERVRIPVLSCSGNGAHTGGQSAAPGIDGFLPEDFEPELFAQTVDRLAHAVADAPEEATDPAPNSLPIFEPEMFQAQVAYDRDLLVEIIDLFCAESVVQIEEMLAALAAGNFDQLSALAHTIKGSLSSLHAPLARFQAQTLETAAKERQEALCRSSFAELKRCLERLDPELKALRQSSLN